MAVVRVATKPGTWEGGANSERNNLLYEVLRRRYRMTKLVWVNHPGDGPEVILSSPAVPQVGDSYALFGDSDALATCVSVDPKQSEKNPFLWEVVAEFDTDRVVAAFSDNPLNQPADVRWDFNKYERPLLRTVDGVPCVTSSGNAYNPPFTWEDARPLITITRNEASYDPDMAYQYHNALNQEIFAGVDPLHARINMVPGHQMFSNGIFFYQVTYEIELCNLPEGFAILALDHDFRDIKGSLFLDPIIFAPASNPTLMNGKGKARTSAVTTLTAAMNGTQTTVSVDNTDSFPPGAEPDNLLGFMPSGHYYFEIRIDDEVIQVQQRRPIVGGPQTWTPCVRGYAGTAAASHSVGAKVTLEPYYKRYIPTKVKSFVPLALPTI